MAETKWEFKSNAKEVSERMDQITQMVLEAIGMYVEGEAKARTPVGQYTDGRVGGRLRKSITYKLNKNSVTIGTSVEYSDWVEKGTSRQKAQPYLTPSVEENTANIQKIVEQGFGKL